MQSETGESSSSILARSDNDAWPKSLDALRGGATLHKPAKLKTYYPQLPGGQYVSGGLTSSFVKKLEKSGVLVWVGEGRYRLASGGS